MQRLSNGMRLHIDPMSGLESAAIGVWFGAGAIDESLPENGIAHLIEHMAFKGTSRRTARQIAVDIEAVGGYLNAATSYQRTGFFARVLRNDLALAIEILADILNDPLLDDRELTKEKEVVVQEIGEAWDTPDDAVLELLQGVAFKGQSLGRPILGSVDSVRSFTPANLRGFMGRLYTAEQTVVVAAGAVDEDMVAQRIEAHFGTRRPGRRDGDRGNARFVSGCASDRRDIEQTHVALAFPAVGARHEDFFATRILAETLGGGMSSRLFQRIREDEGLAYSVYAFADCYDDVGVIGAYAGTDSDKAEKAGSLIRREFEGLLKEIPQSEIDRARAMLKSSLLMGLESPAGRAEAAASQIFTFGEALAPEAIRRKLDDVSADDLRRCAKRALETAPPALAVVGSANAGAIARAVGAES